MHARESAILCVWIQSGAQPQTYNTENCNVMCFGPSAMSPIIKSQLRPTIDDHPIYILCREAWNMGIVLDENFRFKGHVALLLKMFN